MYRHKILAKKIRRRLQPKRFVQVNEVHRWYKDGGDEYFRYTYPLKKTSIVFDVGGYEGEWAQNIYKKYQSNVYVFEPVPKYSEIIKKLFSKDKKVRIYEYGLAGRDRLEKINVDSFSSSTFKKGKKKLSIQMVDIKNFCDENKIKKIDLIKINIEGGEYELLERIIDSGLILRVDYVQVQFHNFVPNAEKRMESIQKKLSKTHSPTYQYWFIWENWKRKGL